MILMCEASLKTQPELFKEVQQKLSWHRRHLVLSLQAQVHLVKIVLHRHEQMAKLQPRHCRIKKAWNQGMGTSSCTVTSGDKPYLVRPSHALVLWDLA